jgi:hypothetical protein
MSTRSSRALGRASRSIGASQVSGALEIAREPGARLPMPDLGWAGRPRQAGAHGGCLRVRHRVAGSRGAAAPGRADDVESAYQLSQAAGPFEKLVIRSANLLLPAGLLTAWAQGYPWLGLTTGWMLLSLVLLLSVIPLGLLIFLPRGRTFEAAMTAAHEQRVVTPELRAAFADPRAAFARRYELVMVGIVVALMVLKAF